MTIVVALKIGDGIVMGADSAATLAGGTGVSNVYFNAEKVVNLVKGWPVGVMAYGLGGLGGRSIYHLAKELRERLTGDTKTWKLTRNRYTISQAAHRVRRFYYRNYYLKDYPAGSLKKGEYPTMGFVVAGYSAKAKMPEIWGITVGADGQCAVPNRLMSPDDSAAILALGDAEAAQRVMRGWSSTVLKGLIDSKVPAQEAVNFLKSLPYERLIHPAMPLQDGIDLVRYVINVQIGFVRFTPGAPTVNEPTDLAAITKHEGFRWIQRKHWYSTELNRPIVDTQIGD